MVRTRGTLADVIARTLESERRLGLPTPQPADEVIRTLLGAIDNLEAARRRVNLVSHSSFAPAHEQAADHLAGCVKRLADARRAAEEFLKPGTSALC